MIQKIIQVGNSTGIIIPKSVLDILGLKPGNEVNLETDSTTKSLIIQSKNTAVRTSSITPHFLKVLEKVNKQYSTALRELAQK